jgi:hypothetical protein
MQASPSAQVGRPEHVTKPPVGSSHVVPHPTQLPLGFAVASKGNQKRLADEDGSTQRRRQSHQPGMNETLKYVQCEALPRHIHGGGLVTTDHDPQVSLCVRFPSGGHDTHRGADIGVLCDERYWLAVAGRVREVSSTASCACRQIGSAPVSPREMVSVATSSRAAKSGWRGPIALKRTSSPLIDSASERTAIAACSSTAQAWCSASRACHHHRSGPLHNRRRSGNVRRSTCVLVLNEFAANPGDQRDRIASKSVPPVTSHRPLFCSAACVASASALRRALRPIGRSLAHSAVDCTWPKIAGFDET